MRAVSHQSPGLPGEGGRPRARTFVVGALVVVVAIGAVVAWRLQASGPARPKPAPARICPVTCLTDGSYVFPNPGNPPADTMALALVEKAIAAENASVRADRSLPWVTVALLNPFTATKASDVSLARIVDQLRGAYLAQEQVNAQGVLGVQLLLVNEGTSAEAGAGQAVRQIKAVQGPDRILAVAGVGISSAQTEAAASALSADGMPMFGAIATADEFNWNHFPGFVQVTPNVTAQARVLATALPTPRNAVLVYDTDSSDLYTSDLKSDFLSEYRSILSLQQEQQPFTPDSPLTGREFGAIASQVCYTLRQPPVVFYAGRAAVLQSLVGEFQGAPNCSGKDIKIITAGDADALKPDITQSAPGDAGGQVSIEYTDIENVGQETPAFTAAYKQDLASVDPQEAGITDPWTVATYDAMMAASTSIERAYSAPAALPTRPDVLQIAIRLNGEFAPASATAPGTLQIGDVGRLITGNIPIFLDSHGTRTQVGNYPLPG